MATMRYENRFAGRMLAYMETKGISIPSVNYSLDDWEIPRTSMNFNIEGNSLFDRIALQWKTEYLQKPSSMPRFFSGDIHKSFLEARDYLKMMEKIANLPASFWDSVGGMPTYILDAMAGRAAMPNRSVSVFKVLFDLPVKHRAEFYVRLCHILNDWDGIAFLRGKRHNYLWDILES